MLRTIFFVNFRDCENLKNFAKWNKTNVLSVLILLKTSFENDSITIEISRQSCWHIHLFKIELLSSSLSCDKKRCSFCVKFNVTLKAICVKLTIASSFNSFERIIDFDSKKNFDYLSLIEFEFLFCVFIFKMLIFFWFVSFASFFEKTTKNASKTEISISEFVNVWNNRLNVNLKFMYELNNVVCRQHEMNQFTTCRNRSEIDWKFFEFQIKIRRHSNWLNRTNKSCDRINWNCQQTTNVDWFYYVV